MGWWFEEFEVGREVVHGTLAVTQADNEAFCHLTRNTQPLHLDEAAAKASPFGRILVNGLYTFSTAVGMSVPDLTEGTLIANLGYDEVRHPNPVFLGDALRVQSRVVDRRPSSKPGRGIATVATEVYVTERDGKTVPDQLVCAFTRTIMVRTRPEDAA